MGNPIQDVESPILTERNDPEAPASNTNNETNLPDDTKPPSPVSPDKVLVDVPIDTNAPGQNILTNPVLQDETPMDIPIPPCGTPHYAPTPTDKTILPETDKTRPPIIEPKNTSNKANKTQAEKTKVARKKETIPVSKKRQRCRRMSQASTDASTSAKSPPEKTSSFVPRHRIGSHHTSQTQEIPRIGVLVF